jgi:hypothetical protein
MDRGEDVTVDILELTTNIRILGHPGRRFCRNRQRLGRQEPPRLARKPFQMLVESFLFWSSRGTPGSGIDA